MSDPVIIELHVYFLIMAMGEAIVKTPVQALCYMAGCYLFPEYAALSTFAYGLGGFIASLMATR